MSAIERVPVHVVAAVIENDGRYLLALRPQGKSLAGHWEFPGGKVEANERPEAAVVRELEEELGARRVEVHAPIARRRHDYEQISVLIDAYHTSCDVSSLRPLEHDQLGWFTKDELRHVPLAPADLFLVPLLRG